MPWRNEDELKGDFPTFESKYRHVEMSIKDNIYKHDPYFDKIDIDVNDLSTNTYNVSSDENDSDSYTEQISFINPNLLDLSRRVDVENLSRVQASSFQVHNILMNLEVFQNQCALLNEEQLIVFNMIMK